MNQSTFWSEELLVNPLVSQAYEKVLKTQEETSCSPILELQISLSQNGFYGKMSQVFSLVTEERTLPVSLKGWLNSGMGSPTEFLTLNISECHKDASVCLLSDILETGAVPRRFYLSPKACAGILRRAARRGKELPPALHHALKAVADSGPTTIATED